jgi:hypothetical protein
MGTASRLFLNRSTARPAYAFFHQRLNEGCGRVQPHALPVHFREQRLPRGVDEIHFA